MQKGNIAAKQSNQDHIHQALRNWAKWINANMEDVPSENPEPAQWQSDYRADNQFDPDKPEPPCDEWAERVQEAVVRLATDNVLIKQKGKPPILAWVVITKFYRDGWENQSRYINWAREQLGRYL